MSEELSYPSGKLGAVTRVKNKITRYCEEFVLPDPDELNTLKNELNSKIEAFDAACEKQLSSKNVPAEDMLDFQSWVKKHKKTNVIYVSKLNIRIAKIDDDSDDECNNNDDSDKSDDGKSEDDKSDRESERNEDESSMAEIAKHLTKLQLSSELPRNEPDNFSGEDITEYQSFKLTFEMMIERKCNSFSDKFFYLMKYTSDAAHELVKSCHCSDMKESFVNAKATLDTQYGNEYKIAQQHLNKLQSWQPIKAEDAEGLKRFSTFLISCSNLMKKMSSLNQLNSMRDIRDITMKLPWNLRTQFRKVIHSVMKKNAPITFQLLVEFVAEQSDILNVPLMGDLSEGKRNYEERRDKRKNGSKTFATNNVSEEEKTEKRKYCHCCRKNNHFLNDCFFFAKKSLIEKEDFIKKMNLCYGCLKTNTHRSKECKEKLSCNICKKTHPSCLHRNEPRGSNADVTDMRDYGGQDDNRDMNLVVKKNEKVMCPVIPVIIRSKVSNRSVTTYMALDNWSTSSFMDKKLLKDLEIDGTEETTILTTIEGQNMKISTTRVENLELLSLNKKNREILSTVNAKDNWPFNKNDVPSRDSLKGFEKLSSIPFKFIDSNVGLLIGMNESHLMKPLEIVESERNGPYASRHTLGWAINGPAKGKNKNPHCYRMKTEESRALEEKIDMCFDKDFSVVGGEVQPSINEKQWLNYVENNTKKGKDNHFEIKLPFNGEPEMPNNFFQVKNRFKGIQKKLISDEKLKMEYLQFMNTMKERGFAERVPTSDLHCEQGKSWFLTHFPVYHKKKGKIRIVFDASLCYADVSLNNALWKGPDLANSLVGVLLRFRDQPIAISGDIEKMYYMINVPEEDRNYLKFFWFETDNVSMEPIQYRLTVHLFGAVTSSSISNFALKKSAEYADDSMVKNIIEKSFYVDDMLASFSSDDLAMKTLDKLNIVLNNSGFNLTSYATNSERVLNYLPSEKISNQNKMVFPDKTEIYFERTLGLKWNTETDELGFEVDLPEQPNTRRGILSTIASVYDPLFLVAPVLIPAKRIFQVVCSLKLNWDDQLPQEITNKWNNWKKQIIGLNEYSIPRCYRSNMPLSDNIQLHIFVDGSEIAYGAVAYLRLATVGDLVVTSLLMSRSRLTPLSRASLTTIPRIELAAAKVGVELYEKVKLELTDNLQINETIFWTDSTSTLRYINSEEGRFHRFVDNRVAYIRNLTDVRAWRHVPGKVNPADILSRGTKNITSFISDRQWKEGPEFLRRCENEWPVTEILQISADDLELKKSDKTMYTKTTEDEAVDLLFNSTSSFFKLKIRVATFLRVKNYLINKKMKKGKFSVDEINNATQDIWRYCQKKTFPDTFDCLSKNNQLPKANKLKKLNPFIDENNLLRVGGRMSRVDLPYDSKYPLILHSSSYPIKLFLRECHKNNGHLGKEYVLSQLRPNYHIVKVSKEMDRIIKRCIVCRKVQAKPLTQKMSDYPVDRISIGDPPFTNIGTDIFGPFYVSRGRGKAQEKRYGVIFTCLTTRATHLELTPSLDTDSFINSLRRFICRRGKPKIVRSDNGTNFTAAEKELRAVLDQWNASSIHDHCLQRNIDWKFNPPYASHFGGVFERQIRTVRKIFNSLLLESACRIRLTDDLLSTLFCEVENVMNNKPLSITRTGERDILICPNDLLLLNSANIQYPPGIFSAEDSYCKRKWRQSQYLADVFWNKYKKEYLPLLNTRSKWQDKKRCLEIGDMVIVSDLSTQRNCWCIGKITAVNTSDDDLVRSAHVDVFNKDMGKKRSIQRPIDKLILLMEQEY